jgi:uncharacterized RDD family membrane protein YckC
MLAGRTTTRRVRTPEGVVFSFLLATPVTRLLAYAIDLACIAAIFATARIGIGAIALVSIDVAQAVMIVSYFVISIGYGMATEWFWRGQTLGKRLLRLRVIDEQGLRLEFTQIAIRNLLRCIDMLPLFYLVGGVACALTRNAQRLGDIAANTIVIRHPIVEEPDLDQLATDKWNSLRDYPHLSARLRHHVTPEAAAVIVDAIMRRAELDPAERVRLFRDLASHFKSIVRFPPEAEESVTDEQYIRNVADVLFR